MANGRREIGKSYTIATRLHSPYREWLEARVKQSGLKKGQLLKLWVMAALDVDMLQIHERLLGIEKELENLRRDFNDAVEK